MQQRDGQTTFVMTSCDRSAELRQTLASVMRSDLSGITRAIVIEDSPNTEVERIVREAFGDFPLTFLQNKENRGQIYSIDRAYAHVETTYIYHCEEDWIFPDGLRLQDSINVMETAPHVVTIIGRNLKTYPRKRIFRRWNRPIVFDAKGTKYVIPDQNWSDKWGGFSFNPGLRRLTDYLALGTYGSLGPESEISRHYKAQGRINAFLLGGLVTHIGNSNRTFKKDERAFAQASRSKQATAGPTDRGLNHPSSRETE